MAKYRLKTKNGKTRLIECLVLDTQSYDNRYLVEFSNGVKKRIHKSKITDFDIIDEALSDRLKSAGRSISKGARYVGSKIKDAARNLWNIVIKIGKRVFFASEYGEVLQAISPINIANDAKNIDGLYFSPSKSFLETANKMGVECPEKTDFSGIENKDVKEINDYWRRFMKFREDNIDIFKESEEETEKIAESIFRKARNNFLNEEVQEKKIDYSATVDKQKAYLESNVFENISREELLTQLLVYYESQREASEFMRREAKNPKIRDFNFSRTGIGEVEEDDNGYCISVENSSIRPLLFWGAPGIGKTQIVQQFAKNAKRGTSGDNFLYRGLGFMGIDLATMRFDDFMIPVIRRAKDGTYWDSEDAEMNKGKLRALTGSTGNKIDFVNQYERAGKNATEKEIKKIYKKNEKIKYEEVIVEDYCKKGILPVFKIPDPSDSNYIDKCIMEDNITNGGDPDTNGDGGILFLDEISRIQRSLMTVLMTLLQKRTIGNFALGSKWMIVAAANRQQDLPRSGEGAFRWDQAWSGRFAQYNFVPTFEEWLEYAEEKGVDKDILKFLEAHREYWFTVALNAQDNSVVMAANPRAWVDASNLIKKHIDYTDRLKDPTTSIAQMAKLQKLKTNKDGNVKLVDYDIEYEFDNNGNVIKDKYGNPKISKHLSYKDFGKVFGGLMHKEAVGAFREYRKSAKYLDINAVKDVLDNGKKANIDPEMRKKLGTSWPTFIIPNIVSTILQNDDFRETYLEKDKCIKADIFKNITDWLLENTKQITGNRYTIYKFNPIWVRKTNTLGVREYTELPACFTADLKVINYILFESEFHLEKLGIDIRLLKSERGDEYYKSLRKIKEYMEDCEYISLSDNRTNLKTMVEDPTTGKITFKPCNVTEEKVSINYDINKDKDIDVQ